MGLFNTNWIQKAGRWFNPEYISKKITQPRVVTSNTYRDVIQKSQQSFPQPEYQMFDASKQAAEQFRSLSPAEKWKEIGGYIGGIAQQIAKAGVKFGYSVIPEVQKILKTGEPSEGLPVGKVGKFLFGTDKITSYQKDIITNLSQIRAENPQEPYYESVAKASAMPVVDMLFDAWITSGLVKAGAKGLEKLLPSKTQINNWAVAKYPTTKAQGIKNIKQELHIYHPDKAPAYGISPQVAKVQSAKLNEALKYFNTAKNPIPNQNVVKNVLGRFGQVLLEQPSQLNELLTQPLVQRGEPIIRGILPSKTGMQPVQPYQPTAKIPAVGLGVKEVPVSPEKPISKAITPKIPSPLAKEATKFLTKTYGITNIADAHNAPWIAPNGKLIGNLADHQESAVNTLKHIGIKPIDKYEAVRQLQESTGIIRLTINSTPMGNELDIDIRGQITPKQLDTIRQLYKKNHQFIYDIYDTQNKIIDSGNYFENFLQTLKDNKLITTLPSLQKPSVSKYPLKFPIQTTDEILKEIRQGTEYIPKPTKPTPLAQKGIKEAVKPEISPKIPMATKSQIAEAHILAKKINLITTTKAGKISTVRYQRLAKGMTGKTSVKKMTSEEADDFINAIQSVTQRQPWEPPVIPMSTKIVPKEFFDIQFKEPGLAKVFTPKEYYLRELGAEPLLKPITDAYKSAYLEQQNINKWIKDIVKKINQVGKTSVKERTIAKILNKPTSAVAKMRDLLDKYETAPDFLSADEAKIFTEVRAFTKSLLERTNAVREKLGLEPINEVKAYISHFVDELSRQIIQKKYPFPEDVKYWIGRNMPAKIHNPTEMTRRVSKELEEVFSKDLGKLLGALSKYDLRDIYLSEPYSILRAELNALGDKIPASTRKEIDAFLKYDIFRYPTELDQMLNRTLEKPTQIINWFLKPFNRVVSNPIKSLSNITRRLVMTGTIWGRPKLAIRNMLTQKLLTMDLYPVQDYIRAQFYKTPEGVMKAIRGTKFYKLSRRFEDIPEGLMKVEHYGMLPYQKSHAGINYLSNVDVATKVGYYYGERMVKLSKDTKSAFYKYAEKYAEKHNVPIKELLWTEEDILAEAEEAGSLTQWLYFATDMPYLYRGEGQRAMLTLQSWWQNFFFKHQREGLTRMIRGRTSRGKLIRPIDRINWIKGTLIILGVLEGLRRTTGLDYQRFLFLWGPAPSYLSPPGQMLLGIYKYMTAKTDYEKSQAERQIKYSYKAFIPGSMAWRDLTAYMKGEKDLKEFLFYTEKEEQLISTEDIISGDVDVADTILKKYGIDKPQNIADEILKKYGLK